MAVKFAAAVAMSLANHLASLVDAAATPGTLIIYDGAEPANPDTAIGSQVALVTFPLGDPSFGAAVDTGGGGQITAEAIAPVDADEGGTAAWFRILDGDGDVILQGSVTDTTGNGDLKVSSTTVVAGIEVSVVSLTFTQRKV